MKAGGDAALLVRLIDAGLPCRAGPMDGLAKNGRLLSRLNSGLSRVQREDARREADGKKEGGTEREYHREDRPGPGPAIS